jgi:hypothetical protein
MFDGAYSKFSIEAAAPAALQSGLEKVEADKRSKDYECQTPHDNIYAYIDLRIKRQQRKRGWRQSLWH